MSSKPSEIKISRREEIPEEDMIDIEKKTVLMCSSCDKKLVSLISIKEKVKQEMEQEYQCSCPYCGDKSFKKKLLGRVIVNVLDPKKTTMLDTESHDMVIEDGNLKYIRYFLKLGKV